jgi:nucleoside-diphosphate-sugar epimerase
MRESNETDAPKPLDVYGCSKLCGELMVQESCKANWSILRFFNIIGRDETHRHLLPAIIEQIKGGDVLTLGNLTTRRDYLFMDDLVRGIGIVLNNRNAYSEILNFGTGIALSGDEVVQNFEKVLNRPLKVTQLPYLKRVVDNPLLVASIVKTKNVIGWEPEFSFERALAMILG